MPPRKILFTCQKNDGRYFLEWLAYHRVIGFDHVIVFSNDCSDGSVEMFERMQALGLCEHHVHTPTDLTPQHNAAKVAMDKQLFRDGDWAMWLDNDEYLVVNVGDGDLDSLIARTAPNDMMMVAWKLFGDSGHATWQGRHISPDLTRCEAFDPEREPTGKSLFRWSSKIERFSAHRPWVREGTSRKDFAAISSAGTRPSPFFGVKQGRKFNRILGGGDYWSLAQVNHYAVRAPDVFQQKAERGAGNPAQSRVRNKYKSHYYRQHNRNEDSDTKILRFTDAVDAEMERLGGMLAASATPWMASPPRAATTIKTVHEADMSKPKSWKERVSWSEGFLQGICTQLGPESTVIDLGANKGDIMAPLVATGAHVIAFEPDPWAYSKLVTRFADAINVEIHNKAVGNSDRSVKLLRRADVDDRPNKASQSSTIVPGGLGPDHDGGSSVDIDVIDFGAFLTSTIKARGDIDFLKVDIEGAEYEVLDRMDELGLVDHVKTIVVEPHAHKMAEIQDYGTEVQGRLSQKYPENRLRFDWI